QGLVDARIEAKKRKDFAEADRIRKELGAKGIILEDDKDKTYWRRKV
ncbi:MAG TPA: cysteine--tRNA ligase, partial [Candidatus Omnitrophota bacterium]|nr:cysteine--tRNA ligase [Candidatus Omnitrophota bacterium]